MRGSWEEREGSKGNIRIYTTVHIKEKLDTNGHIKKQLMEDMLWYFRPAYACI